MLETSCRRGTGKCLLSALKVWQGNVYLGALQFLSQTFWFCYRFRAIHSLIYTIIDNMQLNNQPSKGSSRRLSSKLGAAFPRCCTSRLLTWPWQIKLLITKRSDAPAETSVPAERKRGGFLASTIPRHRAGKTCLAPLEPLITHSRIYFPESSLCRVERQVRRGSSHL